MLTALVGYSGFVGSNLAHSYNFDLTFNSKNISKAYGTNPDLLIYSGLRAEKFIADKFPDRDLASVNQAFDNIKRINPKMLVLISTVDVYPRPFDVDENSVINELELMPYGKNRRYLEALAESEFKKYLIVRLPGLFGKNIKKNFIYDYMNVIPSMLTEQKLNELVKKDSFIKPYYKKLDNGFFKCIELSLEQKHTLKGYFNRIGFSAVNFTDSRAVFQFYNLSSLWEHITVALKNGIKKLNLATEPISAAELYFYLTGKEFVNEITDNPPCYNFKTEYCELFGGKDGYIFDKAFVMNEIKHFTEGVIR